MSLDNRRWRTQRAVFLRHNPLCSYCQKRSEVTAATVVNHHVPHRGDLTLFWDQGNWRACCKRCHDADRQRAERSGRVFGWDKAGNPTDPRHLWNAEPSR